jgi:CYTH domain-containing protein
LSPHLFNKLWPLTQGRRLQKVRYDIEQADLVWEVDIYQKEMTGLMVVEVEFASEEEAESFLVPECFGREVTRDERYKNKNLALYGIPEN